MRFTRHRPALLDERTIGIRSRRTGIVGVIVMTLALAASAVLYIHPFGQRIFAANFTNSGGLRPGDQVRVAGIPIGKVTSVALDRTLVKMTFAISRDVPVGSESTLEVKLLTPLGGHYVALDPKGTKPLGSSIIPARQTTTPFEINDIIQDATPLIEKVDGHVLHDTFTTVADAADRYPNALRNVITTADSLTTSLREVTDDYHRALDFANDYASGFITGRQQLTDMMRQFALVGTDLTSHSTDIVEFFTLLQELARILDRFMVFYDREVAPTANGIDDIFDTLFTHPERLGQAADGLGQILRIVSPMLSGNGVSIDESHKLMPGQDLCIPNITKQC
jgi:phospholipid/cholesterol/gamma-HCH transport system substrate-binding protein